MLKLLFFVIGFFLFNTVLGNVVLASPDRKPFKCCYELPNQKSLDCNTAYAKIQTPEYFSENPAKAKAICEIWDRYLKPKNTTHALLFIKYLDLPPIAVSKSQKLYENFIGHLDPEKGEAFGSSGTDSTQLGPFYWPKGTLSTDEMGCQMGLYSNRAKTCLGKIGPNPASLLWAQCGRSREQAKLTQFLNSLRTSGSLPLKEKRDQFCEIIKKTTHQTYFGCQYGNCGEGAEVGYCLAHQAGFKDLMICTSQNDHQFLIYQNPKEEKICVLDRWDDLKKGHHYCGVKIKKGRVIFPESTLKLLFVASNLRWFRKISCVDPLNDQLQILQKDRKVFDYPRWKKEIASKE